MHYSSVKKAGEIVLEGITVDTEIVDRGLRSVTLTDAKGRVVRFERNEYGPLKVTVPAGPPTVEKHIVSGSVLGVPVREEFEDKYEAERRARQLEGDVHGDTNLKVNTEQVPIDPNEIPF